MSSSAFALICFLLNICPFFSVAQSWKTTELKSGDTIIETKILIHDNQAVHDTTGTHKIVYKYLKFNLLEWRRYDIHGQPAEDDRGVHRKEKFWKYFKFYDKNNKQLHSVQDSYSYEQGDATYCVYKYDAHGNLIEVTYYKDEVVYDKDNRFVVRNQLNAVDAYLGMGHKYTYEYFQHGRTLKEHVYGRDNVLKETRTLKLKKDKKTK
jgi:YD repeat-containing protein